MPRSHCSSVSWVSTETACVQRGDVKDLGPLLAWVQVLSLLFISCGHGPPFINLSDPRVLFTKTRDLITSQVVGRIE